MRNIAMHCPNLRQLCVSKCGELSDHTLIALANHNPLLSTLEVAGCHQFTDIGFQALGKVSICFLYLCFYLSNLQNCYFINTFIELQILRKNGLGRVQSNNRFDAASLGNWLSKLREAGRLKI
jgi:hypothetical protein